MPTRGRWYVCQTATGDEQFGIKSNSWYTSIIDVALRGRDAMHNYVCMYFSPFFIFCFIPLVLSLTLLFPSPSPPPPPLLRTIYFPEAMRRGRVDFFLSGLTLDLSLVVVSAVLPFPFIYLIFLHLLSPLPLSFCSVFSVPPPPPPFFLLHIFRSRGSLSSRSSFVCLYYIVVRLSRDECMLHS